jgi:hypothetical protein
MSTVSSTKVYRISLHAIISYMNAGHEKFSKHFEYVMEEIREGFVRQVRNKMKALKYPSSRLENRECFFLCRRKRPHFRWKVIYLRLFSSDIPVHPSFRSTYFNTQRHLEYCRVQDGGESSLKLTVGATGGGQLAVQIS